MAWQYKRALSLLLAHSKKVKSSSLCKDVSNFKKENLGFVVRALLGVLPTEELLPKIHYRLTNKQTAETIASCKCQGSSLFICMTEASVSYSACPCLINTTEQCSSTGVV